MSKYIPYEVWDEITYPFPNINLGNTLLRIWILIHAEIKVNPC